MISHDSQKFYTHVASNIVDSLITAGHKANEDGGVHNIASSNDKIIEIWASQPDNPR